MTFSRFFSNYYLFYFLSLSTICYPTTRPKKLTKKVAAVVAARKKKETDQEISRNFFPPFLLTATFKVQVRSGFRSATGTEVVFEDSIHAHPSINERNLCFQDAESWIESMVIGDAFRLATVNSFVRYVLYCGCNLRCRQVSSSFPHFLAFLVFARSPLFIFLGFYNSHLYTCT